MFECITCPLNSVGQYPDCVCGDDDGAVYNSNNNLCEKCEGGSTGIFPDCTCPDGGTYDTYNYICVTPSDDVPNVECTKSEEDENNENYGTGYCLGCPFGSNGTYPNCVCDGESVYNKTINNCVQCPFTSVGIYPNCICNGNGTYNATSNWCNECPFDSDGIYPDCICQSPDTSYIMDLNWCSPELACPSDSTGEHPDCVCEQPSLYVQESNLCVSCPENSTGVYPNCECSNGFFSKTHSSCIECPADSIGLYPDCKCDNEKMLFSAYINQCYIECPDNSPEIHPNCRCYGDYFYDINEFGCRSNIGVECPQNSIGIGPDCLCIRRNEKFNSYYWDCVAQGTGFAVLTSYCPDGNGKWPQCEASIERNTLLSLIG